MRRLAIFFGIIWSRMFVGIILFGTLFDPAARSQASVQTSTHTPAQTSAHASVTRAVSPDVYLITIDTLRADHVGCYGYKQVETPALDALAADGVRFNRPLLIARSRILHTLRS